MSISAFQIRVDQVRENLWVGRETEVSRPFFGRNSGLKFFTTHSCHPSPRLGRPSKSSSGPIMRHVGSECKRIGKIIGRSAWLLVLRACRRRIPYSGMRLGPTWPSEPLWRKALLAFLLHYPCMSPGIHAHGACDPPVQVQGQGQGQGPGRLMLSILKPGRLMLIKST